MGKKILSFSLWGKEDLYVRGAFENVRNRDTFFPDWICRFYVGEQTMDAGVVDRLAALPGVEVIRRGTPREALGMFWRFEAMYDDPDVERFLSRDTDCQFTWREVDAVDGWIRSGKPFHIIRDNRQHNIPILGGTWGAVRGAVADMRGLMEKFLETPPETRSQHPGRKYHGVDQIFLCNEIWPRVKEQHLAHIRGGMPALRFSSNDIELPYLLESGHFVGQPCVDLSPDERIRQSSTWKWDSIALFLPTFKRPDSVRALVESACETAKSVDRLRLSLCVNERDDITRKFLEEYKFPIAHEVVYEATRQPNLSKYFNMLYDRSSFNSDGTLVSMLGDDMRFKTMNWDEDVLKNVNERNGNAVVYCNDGFIAGEKLAVNLFTTRQIVSASELPFMCPMFHAEMIDVVWTVVGAQASILIYLSDVLIQHEHGSKPGNDVDETYMRLQPLRQLANSKRGLNYARVYGTMAAANIIKNGCGEWNAEALVGRSE